MCLCDKSDYKLITDIFTVVILPLGFLSIRSPGIPMGGDYFGEGFRVGYMALTYCEIIILKLVMIVTFNIYAQWCSRGAPVAWHTNSPTVFE